MFDLLQRAHIIAYDEKEQQCITSLLNEAGVMPKSVDFMRYPTDDFWVRDNTQTFSKKYKNSCLSQIQNLSIFPYIYTRAPRAPVMSISLYIIKQGGKFADSFTLRY
ncbi:MAG: hypothetical protein ACN6O7_18705 [Sphingobacterium sp.]